jgi:hypothetical protein
VGPDDLVRGLVDDEPVVVVERRRKDVFPHPAGKCEALRE